MFVLFKLQGCCDGKGAWEDCLEQHVTGDVAVAVRMYYYATQDRLWLENIGWPLLRDIARFWSSRITKTDNMTYSINKIMPVDEWCDNTQTKCGSVGINNAIQTNAVAVASLAFATQVGNMFGFEVDPEWDIIAKKLKIGFNHTTQTHIQWDNGN
jgi:trehalose/maltose hydrolase-like predicted phosphorylase